VFYWAELGGGLVLTVSRVTVAADETTAASLVTTVPLTGPLTGPPPGHRRPRGTAGGVPSLRLPTAATVAGLPRTQWRLRLTGSVQAGIAVAGDVVVAASAGGDVAAA